MQFLTWLASLSLVIWILIALGVAFLILTKRQLSLLRQKKEDDLRKLELERLGSLNALQGLSSFEFEHYISNLFKQLGYDAQVTKPTGDGGKDILIYKKSFHAIVECKRNVKSRVTRFF